MCEDINNHGEEKSEMDQNLLRLLADLVGTSVGGISPSSDDINLDDELFLSMNMAIASIVIISELIMNSYDLRNTIRREIDSKYLKSKSIEWFLFNEIVEKLNRNEVVEKKELEAITSRYTQEIWGKDSRKEHDYKINQILRLHPTRNQIIRAIELRLLWAKDNNLLST